MSGEAALVADLVASALHDVRHSGGPELLSAVSFVFGDEIETLLPPAINLDAVRGMARRALSERAPQFMEAKPHEQAALYIAAMDEIHKLRRRR